MENVKNESESSALHFFLYLVAAFSLIFVATGIGSILFQLVNKIFSQDAAFSQAVFFNQSSVKYGIASLLIAAPAFLTAMFLINKYAYEGRIMEGSKIRKWITYVILFIAAAVIIGDLIVLVFQVLEGEYFTNFILKVSVILLIAGSIFSYFLLDMKKRDMAGKRYKIDKAYGGGLLGVVLVILIVGFSIVDSPAVARDKRIDQQTLNDMMNIDSNIVFYFENKGELPETLEEVKATESSVIAYEKIGEDTYRLCTNFLRDMDENQTQIRFSPEFGREWNYVSGENCFERKAERGSGSVKEAIERL